MRALLVDGLAWLYSVVLTLGPFALAVLLAVIYERRIERRIDRTIRGELASGALPTHMDEFTRERALWARLGWRSWALFAVLWVVLQLLAEFVRYNAHAIIRAAS